MNREKFYINVKNIYLIYFLINWALLMNDLSYNGKFYVLHHKNNKVGIQKREEHINSKALEFMTT